MAVLAQVNIDGAYRLADFGDLRRASAVGLDLIHRFMVQKCWWVGTLVQSVSRYRRLRLSCVISSEIARWRWLMLMQMRILHLVADRHETVRGFTARNHSGTQGSQLHGQYFFMPCIRHAIMGFWKAMFMMYHRPIICYGIPVCGRQTSLDQQTTGKHSSNQRPEHFIVVGSDPFWPGHVTLYRLILERCSATLRNASKAD